MTGAIRTSVGIPPVSTMELSYSFHYPDSYGEAYNGCYEDFVDRT
jgi:hypothetical protein